jgi:hypothetical protein
MKMCKDFTPNFGDERNGSFITTTYHLTLPFSPGNFYQKHLDCRPPRTLLFSVSPIEDKN